MATLPQTNPAGGPNPNSPPPTSFGVSIADMPQFAATGNTRAAMANLYAQRQAAALGTTSPAPDPTLAPNAGMPPPQPAYDPTLAPATADLPAWDNKYVPPAPGTNPALTGLGNFLDPNSQTAPVTRETANLRNAVDPGVTGAISNWFSNAVGSPEAQAYNERAAAAKIYADPNAAAYFGQHRDMLTHAQKDPQGFAKLLGPILEAHAKEQRGEHQPMAVPMNTQDGPQMHQSPNGEKTVAIGKAFNLPLDRAHVAANPGMYSTNDYIKYMRGLTNNQVKTLWEMQHYLTPQQQAEAQYVAGANASANQPGGASYLDSVLRTIALGQNATLAGARPGTEQTK